MRNNNKRNLVFADKILDFFGICFGIEPELDRLRTSGDLATTVVGNGLSLVEGPYLRTIPGVHPCDGFFAALIERA